MNLVKYEAARAALQACHDIDEIKDIRDKAQAMAAYAKQAKDTKLVEWASEIKVRAERRAGTMLAEMKINGARHAGVVFIEEYPEGTALETTLSSTDNFEDTHTLETLGVSKKQSAQWQKVAAIPEEKFEKAITQNKESAGVVTTAAVLRSATRPARAAPTPRPVKEKKPAGDPKLQAKYDAAVEQIADLKESLAEMTELASSAEAFKNGKEFKEMQELRAELRALKQRRGELLREVSEQTKLIAYWKKKAK